MKRYLSAQIGTFCLTIAFIGTGWMPMTVKAEEKAEDQITIHAKVAYNPTFGYIVEKNSQVSIADSQVSFDENAAIKVQIRGAEDKPLANQKLVVRVENQRTQKTQLYNIVTDKAGKADLQIPATQALIGDNLVKVVNVSYSEPIEIKDTARFTVQGQNQINARNLMNPLGMDVANKTDKKII